MGIFVSFSLLVLCLVSVQGHGNPLPPPSGFLLPSPPSGFVPPSGFLPPPPPPGFAPSPTTPPMDPMMMMLMMTSTNKDSGSNNMMLPLMMMMSQGRQMGGNMMLPMMLMMNNNEGDELPGCVPKNKAGELCGIQPDTGAHNTLNAQSVGVTFKKCCKYS